MLFVEMKLKLPIKAKKIKKQKTILLIEHNMNVVMELAQTITVLETGEVLAQGTPIEIKSNPDVQEAYLGHAEA